MSSMLSCLKNRTWCPTPQLLNGSVITKLEPPSYEIGSRLSLACLRGLDAVEGHMELKCMLGTGLSGSRGEWRAQTRDGRWNVPPIPLQCKHQMSYCPDLRSASADRIIAPGLLTEDEPYLFETRIINQTIAVPANRLGTTVTVSCPEHFQRVRGDSSIVCDHGAKSGGTWQVAGAPVTTLVDDAIAEPLVCELDTSYGVFRHYFTTTMREYGGEGQSGYDVVPNIDQHTSAFDAAYFKSFLRPPRTGKYTLYVEVVGRFLLSFQERVLLTGRSHSSTPKRFKSGILQLELGEYYEIHLQYALDPAMPEERDPAPMPRHVRLLWQSDDNFMHLEPVPPTALRHSFSPLAGYSGSAVATLVNDPNPCDSKNPVLLHSLPLYSKGTITHGSTDRNYNANLDCKWHLTAPGLSRFNFIVEFFDVQPSRECTADAVVFRIGLTGDILQSMCGSSPKGGVLMTRKDVEIGVQFRTDGMFEGRGFNITYEVLPSFTDAPTGPATNFVS